MRSHVVHRLPKLNAVNPLQVSQHSLFFPYRRLSRYLTKFSKANILVIGDLILDHFIWGSVDRISPEAPVPVVHVDSESLRLGGAANVYNNILSLGGKAEVCGVIGSDESGKAFLNELGIKKSNPRGVIIDSHRPTSRKTRIVAHSQQIVRYDVEKRSDVSAAVTRQMIQYIRTHLQDISCLVISDYAKGVVTASLMAEISRMARKRKIPIIVDPKVDHLPYYAGVTILTPNHLEAQQGAEVSNSSPNPIIEAGHQIRHKLGCEAVLVTRGEHGMTLSEADGSSSHIPAVARQVYDVTGAGDTVVSTLALAMSAGASIKEGAVLANHAAGLVVGMVGTACVTNAQLREAILHAKP